MLLTLLHWTAAPVPPVGNAVRALPGILLPAHLRVVRSLRYVHQDSKWMNR